MKYNWQQADWPQFHYNINDINTLLIDYVELAGKGAGLLTALSDHDQRAVLVDGLVIEALKNAQIEGEQLSRTDVYSSLLKHFDLPGAATVRDRYAQGMVDMMMAMRREYAQPLSADMLHRWHRLLMAGRGGEEAIGQWRSEAEPMQVVSGPVGRWIVHFEAPPASRVSAEMQAFIAWFNRSAPDGAEPMHHAPVRAAICHLYFESVHPYHDGNGRIGRALAEKVLLQASGEPGLVCLSKVIEAKRNDYYDALERAQRSNDITAWVHYFVELTLAAQVEAHTLIHFVVRKAKFYNQFKERLNARQYKAVQRMWDAGPSGFEGGMTATKYMHLAKTSKATATRDLQELVQLGALVVQGSGRGTRYVLGGSDDR